MGQKKNRPSEKLHKKDRQDLYNCYKLRLRAIKEMRRLLNRPDLLKQK